MSRKTITVIVIAVAAVLLAAGLAVAATGGTGRTSGEKKCGSAAKIAEANALSGRNQGEESQVRSEHCEQVEKGECAGDCERLRERLRDRDGDEECPCEGTGEQYRNRVGVSSSPKAAGSAEAAGCRCDDENTTGGATSGNCAGDCLRERDRARDCALDGSGGV